ncbi:MAG: PKD domain-containing protein, partial [Vicinamibacteria bacterium]
QYHSQVTARPLPSSFQGTEPGIRVGSTGSGPNLPPGFSQDGIDGYITQDGTVIDSGDTVEESAPTDREPPTESSEAAESGGGGGGKAVLIVAGVAGAAAAGGLAVLGARDEAAPEPLIACFTTSPDPPVIGQGENIRLDGSCSEPAGSITSYEWDLGDGRRREGISINPAYRTGGTFTVSLTVSDGAQSNTTARTVTVRANEADLRLAKRGFNFRDFILFGLAATNEGPNDATGVVLTDTIPSSVKIQPESIAVDDQRVSCTSDGSTLTCKLSLLTARQGFAVTFRTTPASGSIVNTARVTAIEFDPDPLNNEATLTLSSGHRTATVGATSFMSSLKGGDPDAVARGRVVINSAQADATGSSAPFRHSARGREENTVEAYSESGLEGEGLWQFDFSGDQHFIPGSIKVELGQVLSRDAHSVVFRLSGAPGERIKFTYRLRP